MGNHVADASPLQLSKRRPDFAHLNERVNSARLAHGTLTIPPCVNRRGGVPPRDGWPEHPARGRLIRGPRHQPLVGVPVPPGHMETTGT